MVVLTPMSLALGLTAGLIGTALRGISLHKSQQLLTNTAVSIEKKYEDPPMSRIPVRLLAAMVLQNGQALDLLTAGQGGWGMPFPMMNEELRIE